MRRKRRSFGAPLKAKPPVPNSFTHASKKNSYRRSVPPGRHIAVFAGNICEAGGKSDMIVESRGRRIVGAVPFCRPVETMQCSFAWKWLTKSRT